MTDPNLALLQLMQLADSAVPIGSAAHAYGLETLIEEGSLTASNLAPFLAGWLEETGLLEAGFCRAGWEQSPQAFAGWATLNQQMGALKPARESREASARLGRRFLNLAYTLTNNPTLSVALEVETVYHPLAFGLVGNTLGLDADLTITTYLHSAVGNLIWASQRLLPVGQNMAGQLWWQLKPLIIEITRQSQETTPDTVASFMPMLDLGSFRHPDLPTRLFIS